MAQKESVILGGYLGLRASSFGSGGHEFSQYEPTLEHLKEVLANATPTGDPCWGNKGIRITSWIHKGETVIEQATRTVNEKGLLPLSLEFYTLESFEQRLAELDAI